MDGKWDVGPKSPLLDCAKKGDRLVFSPAPSIPNSGPAGKAGEIDARKRSAGAEVGGVGYRDYLLNFSVGQTLR